MEGETPFFKETGLFQVPQAVGLKCLMTAVWLDQPREKWRDLCILAVLRDAGLLPE